MSHPNRVYEQLVAEKRTLPTGKVPLPIVAANLTYEGRRYRIVVDRYTSLRPEAGRYLIGGPEEPEATPPAPRPRLSFTVEVHETDAMGGPKWETVRSSHVCRPLLDALLDTILQLTVPFDGMPEPPPLVTSPDERPAVWDRLDDEIMSKEDAAEVDTNPAEIADGPFVATDYLLR